MWTPTDIYKLTDYVVVLRTTTSIGDPRTFRYGKSQVLDLTNKGLFQYGEIQQQVNSLSMRNLEIDLDS